MTSGDRILLTGGAGFLGANLVRRLVADGADVHLLLSGRSDVWRLYEVLDHVSVSYVDLRDRDAVDRAVARARPRRVFHLATHGAYSSQQDVHAILETNLMGTVNLVEASLRAGVESIVNTGSSSEYGYRDHAPGEHEHVDPNSHYAVGKASATMYCRFSSLASGVPITTLRLYSVYGPWEEPTRLVPRLVVTGVDGRWPPLVSPRVARDYVHVDDVVEACLLAASVPLPLGSVLNIATGEQTTLADLADIAVTVQPRTQPPVWSSMPDRAWDAETWVGDPALAARLLAWRTRTPLADGYARMLDWLLTDGGGHLATYRTRAAE